MESEWTCPKHPEQPVSFICTGNVWHFEPLCNLCVPDHTKNHPKHIKVQLEALPEVVKKATDKVKAAAKLIAKAAKPIEKILKYVM